MVVRDVGLEIPSLCLRITQTILYNITTRLLLRHSFFYIKFNHRQLLFLFAAALLSRKISGSDSFC